MNALLMPRHWGLTARLVVLAIVPACLMAVAITTILFVTARSEVMTDIRERGGVITAALAEASQYGVISGDKLLLERTVRGLMATDRSIASVHVFDAQRRPIVTVQTSVDRTDSLLFEAPIGTSSADINLFDLTATSSRDKVSDAAASPPVGWVRVVMSPAPMLALKQARLLFAGVAVLLAALASATVGLLIARRLKQPLEAMVRALRQIRRGNYDVTLKPHAQGELGELQATIEDMAHGLGLTRQDLENQVFDRTKQLREAVAHAQAADAEKRRLIAHGNVLIEEERRRISAEIHDDLNATLVSIRLQASALAARAEAKRQTEVHRAASQIADATERIYRRARAIVKELRPEVLDTLGLSGAIEEMVRHFDELHPHCSFRFLSDAPPPPIPERQAIAAYRVVQEALSNVVKHANASTCKVTLNRLPDLPGVRLDVADNGRGFDTGNASSTGLGLIGMKERISALGGDLHVESSAIAGTTITMQLPLDA